MRGGFESPLLAALADRQIVDVSSLAAALPDPSPPPFERLAALRHRLPAGLVHAERVYVLAEPPPDLAPLAPESAWYASERSLVVVLDPKDEGLEGLLVDLAEYCRAAAHIHERLASNPELVAKIDAQDLDPIATTQLALALDAAPSAIASVAREAPATMIDLAWMARRVFDPEVHVHADLTPSGLQARGHAIAEALLHRIAPGTFRLLVSDHLAPIELLSPYTRDLGHALYAWSLENPSAVKTRGLVDAIRDAPSTPDDDLAALVVPDLFRRAPELLEERRAQESTQGLWLEDTLGTAYGVADAAALAAPDRAVVDAAREGALAVVAGGAPDVLLAATHALLDSGRVQGFAGIFGAVLDDDRAVIPSALVDDDDAVRLATTNELEQLATTIDLSVLRANAIPVSRDRGASRIAMSTCEAIRRTRVLGSIEPDTGVYLVLYPRRGGGLTRARAVLDASRLSILALFSKKSHKSTVGSKSPKSESKPHLTRRFRA